MFGDIFGFYNGVDGLLLASSGSGPGMLLNIIWCTDIPLNKEVPNIISAEVEKPQSGEMSPQQTVEEENPDGFLPP